MCWTSKLFACAVPKARPASRRRLTLAAVLILTASAALPAVAQNCDTTCNYCDFATPAVPVPSALWNGLEPASTTTLPGNRDSTDFNGVGSFELNPYWLSLDVEQNFVFAATSMRFQIWDARFNPGSPSALLDSGINSLPFNWTPDAHAFSVFTDIDAPPGKADRVAIGGVYGLGVAIVDTSIKDTPRIKYQDTGTLASREVRAVYTTTIDSRDYVFVAANREGGVFAYDMTAAMNLTGRCNENQPGTTFCPGIYLGKIGSRIRANYLDGAGDFIVLSSTFSPRGFEIWDVSNPSQPSMVMDALSGDSIYGVALWQDGADYYLAARTDTQARIYDVSCITDGFCSPGSPMWSRSMDPVGDPLVTFSRSTGDIPFLYFGDSGYCQSGNQKEWLYDVRNPSSPTDISPQGTVVINGAPVSYWGWYYRQNGVHGFNRVAPRVGKFSGDYFFRAGHAIFDVHRRTGGAPPNPDFTWTPAQIYPGTQVDFFDSSTGGPTAWDWDFLPDGNPGGSTSQNPANIAFDGAGSKTVALQASNGAGSNSTQKNLTVLEPEPVVTGVASSPNPALLCQPVTFTAQNVTGQPPLTFSWQISQNGGGVVASGGNVNPFVWTSTPGQTTGTTYTAEVTVTNSAGIDTATSAAVTLNPLDPLPANGAFTPTYDGQPDPPATGTVQFHAGVSGATEWNWSFGDNPGGGPNNDGFEGWTSDPVDGPNPVHTYDVAATYDVQVMVRNCAEVPRTSAILAVDASNAEPVIADFRASLFCAAGTCFADVNVPITFIDESIGEPDFWDYDWDGDGSFEDEDNPAPVTLFTYTSTGTFHPRLRVRRNSASDIYEGHPIINVGGAPEPSVTVTGPTTADRGHAVTFNASTTNCTPNADGWTWTTSGGVGSSSTSQLTVAWFSNGAKTVEVSNSACGAASDSLTVNVSGSATVVFTDGFEAGTLGGWTTSVTDN